MEDRFHIPEGFFPAFHQDPKGSIRDDSGIQRDNRGIRKEPEFDSSDKAGISRIKEKPGKKIRIDLEDKDGAKYSFYIEGNIIREKIIKIFELFDLKKED